MQLQQAGGPADHGPAMLQFGHANPQGGSSLCGLLQMGTWVKMTAGFLQPWEWRVMQSCCTAMQWQFALAADPGQRGSPGGPWPADDHADHAADDVGSGPTSMAESELEYRVGLGATPPASPGTDSAATLSLQHVDPQDGPLFRNVFEVQSNAGGDPQDDGPSSGPPSIADSEVAYRVALWKSPLSSPSIDWGGHFLA